MRLSHPDDPLLGAGNLGLWSADKATIYLNRDQGEAALQETLFHELLHAIDDRVSLGFNLSTATKTDFAKWHAYMEMAVRLLSPAVCGLSLLGKRQTMLLRMPKAPPKLRK